MLPVTTDSIAIVLKNHGLRDTQTRRTVLGALHANDRPLTPAEICGWAKQNGNAINLVTIYRILEVLTTLHIVHRHASGMFSLCSMPNTPGHHGFLRCTHCGKIEEFQNRDLCRLEDTIAKNAGFTAQTHRSEIVGICADCHS